MNSPTPLMRDRSAGILAPQNKRRLPPNHYLKLARTGFTTLIRSYPYRLRSRLRARAHSPSNLFARLRHIDVLLLEMGKSPSTLTRPIRVPLSNAGNVSQRRAVTAKLKIGGCNLLLFALYYSYAEPLKQTPKGSKSPSGLDCREYYRRNACCYRRRQKPGGSSARAFGWLERRAGACV